MLSVKWNSFLPHHLTFIVVQCSVLPTEAKECFSVLGCGHCKKAKPEFMDAAKHDAENSKVTVVLFKG